MSFGWNEPKRPVPRGKTSDLWKDKHRNVVRKLVLETGWVQNRLYDVGWSDEKKCRSCNKEEGTERTHSYHCTPWTDISNLIPEERRATRKECKRLREDFEVGGFMAPETVVVSRQKENV